MCILIINHILLQTSDHTPTYIMIDGKSNETNHARLRLLLITESSKCETLETDVACTSYVCKYPMFANENVCVKFNIDSYTDPYCVTKYGFLASHSSVRLLAVHIPDAVPLFPLCDTMAGMLPKGYIVRQTWLEIFVEHFWFEPAVWFSTTGSAHE